MFRGNLLCSDRLSAALASIVLLCAAPLFAQHHGGHGLGGGLSTMSRPDGVDEKDTLKDFHQALAVQATSQQITEFQQLIHLAGEAKDKLDASAPDKRDAMSSLDQALDSARTASRKFQEGMSEPQKLGLKEILKRLDKSDSDLQQESRRFDQSTASDSTSTRTALAKALGNFSDEQLALGREMGITLASGQDVAFNFPPVQNALALNGNKVPIGFTGELLQTASQGDLRTFQFNALVDFTDLQQDITSVMHAQLDQNHRCGVRLTVKQASLLAASPASSLFLNLHFERWSCTANYELAESDGKVEIMLTAGIENSVPHVSAEFKRIDATGMMADELRSGDLGDDLRDKVAKTFLAALQAGANVKSMPPAVQQTLWQSARFQDGGAGTLRIMLNGEVHLSNEQVTALAGQLNQTLAAQSAAR